MMNRFLIKKFIYIKYYQYKMATFPLHAFLDANNGDDGTALLTRKDLPFKTFAAAYAAVVGAAQQRDAWVFCLNPGPYNENFNFNDPTFTSQVTGPTNAIIDGSIVVSGGAVVSVLGLTVRRFNTLNYILNILLGQRGTLTVTNCQILGISNPIASVTADESGTTRSTITINKCNVAWTIPGTGTVLPMFNTGATSSLRLCANSYQIGGSPRQDAHTNLIYKSTFASEINDSHSTMFISQLFIDQFVLATTSTAAQVTINNMTLYLEGISAPPIPNKPFLIANVQNGSKVRLSQIHINNPASIEGSMIPISCPPWTVAAAASLQANGITENGMAIPCNATGDVDGNVAFHVTTGGGTTVSNGGQGLAARTVNSQITDDITFDDYSLFANTKKGDVTLCLPLQDPAVHLEGKLYRFRNTHPCRCKHDCCFCNKFIVKSKDAKIDKKSKCITVKTKIDMQFHDGVWWTL